MKKETGRLGNPRTMVADRSMRHGARRQPREAVCTAGRDDGGAPAVNIFSEKSGESEELSGNNLLQADPSELCQIRAR